MLGHDSRLVNARPDRPPFPIRTSFALVVATVAVVVWLVVLVSGWVEDGPWLVVLAVGLLVPAAVVGLKPALRLAGSPRCSHCDVVASAREKLTGSWREQFSPKWTCWTCSTYTAEPPALPPTPEPPDPQERARRAYRQLASQAICRPRDLNGENLKTIDAQRSVARFRIGRTHSEPRRIFLTYAGQLIAASEFEAADLTLLGRALTAMTGRSEADLHDPAQFGRVGNRALIRAARRTGFPRSQSPQLTSASNRTRKCSGPSASASCVSRSGR